MFRTLHKVWLGFAVVYLFCGAFPFKLIGAQEGQAPTVTQPQPAPQSTSPPAAQPPRAAQTSSSAQTNDTSAIQQEVGDRDITYTRDRAVFRYDYKQQDEQVACARQAAARTISQPPVG